MITQEGCGGFLCPPTHPMHEWSWSTSREIMSLESARNADWIPAKARSLAAKLLDEWQPLPLPCEEVQDWIRQVLGYFRGCYADGQRSIDDETRWHASNLTIDQKRDPLEYADKHAGVHLIQKYYPEFSLTAEHVEQAYWGKKCDTTG